MLVLSRKTDEQIVIGNEIRITVLRVQGDRVKLGIQAGDDMKIMRGELLDISSDPHEDTVADPTAGLVDEEFSDDGTSPTGARENFLGPSSLDPRPAWLTICCCS